MTFRSFPKPTKQIKSRRVLKPRWIRPGQVKSYDDAIRYLRMIDEGKRRAEQSAYEAILTQLFQYRVRTSGDCVLRNTQKPWSDGGLTTAGHVFTRAVKELKWDERNTYPQCQACNKMHGHYPFIFHDWCRAHIGEIEYDKLKTIARFGEVFIISFEDVMKLIEKYRP